jgi:hypothetical protein
MSESTSVHFTLGGTYLFRVLALRHAVGMGGPYGSMHSLVGADLTLERKHVGDPFPYAVGTTAIRGPVSQFVKDALGRPIFGQLAISSINDAGQRMLDISLHASADCLTYLQPLLVSVEQGTLMLQLQTDIQIHRFEFVGSSEVKVLAWDLSQQSRPLGPPATIKE